MFVATYFGENFLKNVQTIHKLPPADHRKIHILPYSVILGARRRLFYYYAVITSDEAYWLSGYVNKQNFNFSGTEYSHKMHEEPLHLRNVTVWYDVCSVEVIGTYFFVDVDGTTVTVIGFPFSRFDLAV